MRLLLKEALRRLCAEAGWSYAVFWRAVDCDNSRHLLWEEGYNEPSRASYLCNIQAFEPSNSILEGHKLKQMTNDCGVGEVRSQDEDGISLLVEKMMKPLVHLVGYGIVGCAAFTGVHQWVLQNSFNGGSSPEVLTELSDQFLAGIQTVAVIPVIPHGVIQLGSIQTIIENTRFVNYARSLFLQLGGVTGSLLCHTLQPSIHPKLHISGNQFENCHSEIDQSTAFVVESGNHQNFSTSNSRPITQHCSSVSEIYQSTVEMPLIAKHVHVPMTTTTNELEGPPTHVTIQPRNAEEFANSCYFVEQQSVSHDSICDNRYQPSFLKGEVATSGLESVGWHLSSFRAKQSFSSKFTSEYDKPFYSDTYDPAIFTSSHGDSCSFSYPEKQESHNSSTELGKFASISHSLFTENVHDIDNGNPSHVATVRVLNDTDFTANNCVLSRDVTAINNISNYLLAETIPEKQKNKGIVFRVNGNPGDSSSACPGSSNFEFFQTTTNTANNGGNQNCQTKASYPQSIFTGEKTQNDNCLEHTVNENISSMDTGNSTGNDLFDALGADFITRLSTRKLDDFFDTHAWESSTDTSTCLNQSSSGHVLNLNHAESSCEDVFADTGQDQLLDAIVYKINSGAIQSSDGNVSCKTSLSKVSNSTVHLNPSKIKPSGTMHWDSLGLLSSACDTEAAGSVSVRSSCSMDNIGDCSIKDGQHKSQISLWVESTQCVKKDSSSSSHCKKSDETDKSNRKRPKPGESPRPRPKDRQMIQDRVKELREIVPNGAKCSIDALLERTIKHMLFLQSVTKHADKLRETGEPKILGEGGLLMKDNFEGGATWAFEVGSQSMVCPIIVEDLNPPRQLLVEMLCEDRGFFLEIADSIKGLGFTILKGMMESCNGKVWARFTVEANRDVTRMDIFLSLVRLLEPSVLSNISPQDIGSLNLAQNVSRRASIPSTIVADKLI